MKKGLPLVLVSQVQRSGGSMMAQLFDHHPQLCAHPFEIQTGHPRKWNWIDFEFGSSIEAWFDQLFEPKLKVYQDLKGYKKAGSNSFADSELFPFDYDKDEHRASFIRFLDGLPQLSNRRIYDAYFSSFFQSWKNGIRSRDPKYITGFTPRVNMEGGEAEKFFRDYSDGLMITLVRNPLSWYASSKVHRLNADPNFNCLELETIWMQSLQRSLELKQKYPNQVLLLTYEQVVGAPEEVMTFISNVLGIDYDPILTKPTYAGYELYPNSSFDVAEKGVVDRTQVRIDSLTKEEFSQISKVMLPSYDIYKKHTDLRLDVALVS